MYFKQRTDRSPVDIEYDNQKKECSFKPKFFTKKNSEMIRSPRVPGETSSYNSYNAKPFVHPQTSPKIREEQQRFFKVPAPEIVPRRSKESRKSPTQKKLFSNPVVMLKLNDEADEPYQVNDFKYKNTDSQER
jgi:hypothetical protein